jgi:Ran GTPase-activating protein (RanGAP) involved in mRNA processing and transport
MVARVTEGVSCVVDALERNTQLTHLNLEHNNLGPRGGSRLVRCSLFYRQTFALDDAIALHTFALLEALPCV